VGSNMDKIFIVMDYVEHDLKSLMETMKQKKQVFIPGDDSLVLFVIINVMLNVKCGYGMYCVCCSVAAEPVSAQRVLLEYMCVCVCTCTLM
jgi:hypothetical protein